jgi:hypothetical protein
MFNQMFLRMCLQMLVHDAVASGHCQLPWLRKVGMRTLSDQDRQALRLADELRKAMAQWLSQRGMGQTCAVSPFVDPAGQPSVILTMNAQVASALIESLRPSRTPPAGPSSADGTAGNVPFIP